MKINDKDIRLTNREAIILAKKRAVREGRSAANAAAITIIEALSPKSHPLKHNFHDSIVEKGPKSQEIT